MAIGYISINQDRLDYLKSEIQNYAEKKGLELDSFIVDTVPDRSHWEKRTFFAALEKSYPGDVYIMNEASDIARSTSQVLEALEMTLQKGVVIYFMKYDQVFTSEKRVNVRQFLSFMQHIESDFVAKRTTEALARRRAAGLPLGRPKGKLNKTLKLDKYRKDIMRYLELKISKASIAKLVGCHPQTLYNYMEKRDLIKYLDEDHKADFAKEISEHSKLLETAPIEEAETV